MRYTQADGNRFYVPADQIEALPDAFAGPAIARLAAYETFVDQLREDVAALTAELEILRAAGKEKTFHAREQMGKKLLYTGMLDLMKLRGL